MPLTAHHVTEALHRDGTPVGAYAVRVLKGDIVAGPLVRQACERHLRDILRAGPGHMIQWDQDACKRALAFFPCLNLAEGAFAGQPFMLQPWQQFVIGSIFGWKGADGWRRFRTAYCEIGKGNGKSPMAGGIGLYGMIADNEASAEIYSAATTREQAKILWLDAKKMVEASADLQALIDVKVSNLTLRGGYSFFRPVSSEHRGLDGKRPHIVLVDEVHEHPSGIVIDKMRAGTKGRRQALIFEITNSGHDRTSVCWAHHEYSRRVLAGEVENDAWFAYVCCLDEADDPFEDEACWVKANPNLGVSIATKYIREQVDEARGMPSKENIVRRLNFCEWTQTLDRAIDLAAWNAAPPFETPPPGTPCWAGLDLGQTDDFSAFVVLWALDGGRYACQARFWLPEAALERYPDRPYGYWRRAGLLETTEGDITDYDQIEDAVAALCDEHGVREVAYDKRFAQQLALHLEGKGITMIDTPQGFQLNEACVRLGELVAAARLAHGHHAILTWMAANLVFRTGRNQEVRPDKDTPGEKMDGMVALIMALSRAIVDDVDDDPYTATRGLQFIDMA